METNSNNPIAPKRTRKAHQPNCACITCKNKRMKEGKENNTPPVLPKGEEIKVTTPTPPLDKEVGEAIKKQTIIEEYFKSLPDNTDIIVFEPEAINALRQNIGRLKAKYPDCKTSAELATKIINQCLIKFCSQL